MRLNIATRHSHAELDEPWLALLQPTVTRADYLNVLVRTYGFLGPFEGACKYTPDLGRIPLLQHTRAGLIAQDLLALGLSPAQVANIPQCASITTFRGVAEALGWFYVVERSTLLHEGVCREVQLHVPGVENALAYVSAHGGHVSENWTTLGRLLDRIGVKPDVASEVITSARAGFETMKEWFHNTRAHQQSAG